VPDPEKPAPAMDPDARQRKLFQVLHRVVDAGEGASINLIEDLHWIDAGSEAWLEQMVDAVSGSSNLLIVNFRPEYRSDWMQKPWYRQLPLLPLGREAIQELLGDLLGTDESVTGLAELVYERTAGNPFFAEEVVQALIEAGNLEGTRGSHRLVTPIEEIAVPGSVQAVLTARIDRLAEREKQLLQAAAVIGKEFPEPILAAILDWPDADISAAIQLLKNGEFLYEQSLYPVTEYAFKHPLTQEVALGSQLKERRASTHAKVAAAIERAQPERLDENAALLAHHYEEAGDLAEAARKHRLAAIWLLNSDASESRAHWHRILELIESLGNDEEWMRLELETIDLLLTNGWRFGNVGEPERRRAERGIALAEQLGARAALVSVTWGYAISLSCDGQYEAAEGPARRAVELAGDLDDEFKVMSRSTLFDIFWHSGRIAEAVATADEIFAMCPPDYGFGTKRLTFSTWSWQEARYGICHFLQGRPDEARPLFSKALAFSKEHKEEEVTAWILGWSGSQFEDVTGEVQHALSNAQQALELASRCGSPLTTTASLYILGWAQLMHGHFDDAVVNLERARHAHLDEKQARGWTDLTLGLLAEAYLAVGRSDAARELAETELHVPGARTCRLRARISQARVLRALDGAAATPRIEALVDDADLMLEQSAAYAYRPMIAEERARLAIANGAAPREQLRPLVAQYAEVGGVGHVRRLEAELGA